MTEQQEVVQDAGALVDRAERDPTSIHEAELRRAFWYLQQIVRDPRLQKAS